MSDQPGPSYKVERFENSHIFTKHPSKTDAVVTKQKPDEGARYERIGVLIIEWDASFTGDKAMLAETDALVSVLRNTYNHSVEHLVLTGNAPYGPQEQLQAKVQALKDDFDGPLESHLLMVCYNGHGGPSSGMADPAASLVMTPRGCSIASEPQMPHVTWKPVDEMLQDSGSDVLVILDCCSAGSAMQSPTAERLERSLRTFELMAACGPGASTRASGYHSYTWSLTQELHAAAQLIRQSHEATVSIYALDQKLLRRASWEFGTILYNRGCATQPRHILLAPLKTSEATSVSPEAGNAPVLP
ncbi:hypothetical protein LTR95_013120 [Oleoguttula sp. CCFEE 5521]